MKEIHKSNKWENERTSAVNIVLSRATTIRISLLLRWLNKRLAFNSF